MIVIAIRVGRKPKGRDTRPVAFIPDFLPQRGWQITKSKSKARGTGYLRFTSRSTKAGIKRGARCHRVVIEHLAGRPLEPNEHVHHQNSQKLHCCPFNLILLCPAMNPRPHQDPYTGQRLTSREYEQRYGHVQALAEAS